MLPLRHRTWWVALTILLLVAVVYGSLKPGLALPVPGNLDKFEHCGVYFVLALWFTGLFPRSAYTGVVIALLALGGSMEILQGLMAMGRSAEVLDMLANTVGIACGVLLAVRVTGNWPRRVEAWLSQA